MINDYGISGGAGAPWNQIPRRRRSQATVDYLARVHERLCFMEAYIVTQDSDGRLAAEAYEGLRNSVVMAARERRRHVVMLAQLAEAIRNGQSQDVLASKTQEWMSQAGVIQSTDGSHPEHFDFDNVPSGNDDVIVSAPAYVDVDSGALIQAGRATYVAKPVDPSEPLGEVSADLGDVSTNDPGTSSDDDPGSSASGEVPDKAEEAQQK